MNIKKSSDDKKYLKQNIFADKIRQFEKRLKANEKDVK